MITPNPSKLKTKIYDLCVKNNYFNCGTHRQYDKMFFMAESPFYGAKVIAGVIWVCSYNADYSRIFEQLINICKEVEDEENDNPSYIEVECFYE